MPGALFLVDRYETSMAALQGLPHGSQGYRVQGRPVKGQHGVAGSGRYLTPLAADLVITSVLSRLVQYFQ